MKIKQRMITNLKTWKTQFIATLASIFVIATTVLAFITFEDIGINSAYVRILILLGLVCLSGILSLLVVLSKIRNTICDETNCKIVIKYGNLMHLAFPKKISQKRIIVIPVNQCFDLSCKNNLIRNSSVHGQWIENYIHSDEERSKLSIAIQKKLKIVYGDGELLSRQEKSEGNLTRYPAGTIIEIKSKYNKNICFYLLALAKLDKELKAQCSELEFHQAVLKLLQYYDCNGQGIEMFCPVMSDKTIKPLRPTNVCINFMLSILRFNQQDIRGTINIIVYKKLKNKVSIFDY